LLSSGKVEYFSAASYARNAPTERLSQIALSIARQRFVGENGLQDHVVVRNETRAPVAFTLELDVGVDFADIISVKEHDFALGDPLHAPELPPPAQAYYDEERGRIVLAEGDGRGGRTHVLLSRAGEGRGGAARFPVGLAALGTGTIRVDVTASLDGDVEKPEQVERRFATERARVRESLEAWALALPQLTTSSDDLRHAFAESTDDLAALRLRTADGTGPLPAAGMPWFMTVFGRDTIVTSLHSILLGPELAVSALAALVDLQADTDDPSIDAEPGKILHELRRGRAAESGSRATTGRPTPLYLVGHLLWSGIVPGKKVDAIVDALMRHELWSGWAVRTMSKSDAGYNPLSYHNGTVWPHDTALAAWGLARYGRWGPVHRIARSLLEATRHFDWSLPEVFAGFDRSETPFPIAYPTAARPQAWAAGTPLLLLRLLLGLEPDVAGRRLTALPGAGALDGVEISLTGVRALGRLWNVTSSAEGVGIEPSP
jgi:glycogen debranching enzyme